MALLLDLCYIFTQDCLSPALVDNRFLVSSVTKSLFSQLLRLAWIMEDSVLLGAMQHSGLWALHVPWIFAPMFFVRIQRTVDSKHLGIDQEQIWVKFQVLLQRDSLPMYMWFFSFSSTEHRNTRRKWISCIRLSNWAELSNRNRSSKVFGNRGRKVGNTSNYGVIMTCSPRTYA